MAGFRAALSEHNLIGKYFAPLVKDVPGAFDLTDDAALIEPRPDRDLLITTDTIVAGVHFFEDDAPADIAWKAVAVNVSDIVAKGGAPTHYQLSLSLPEPQSPPEWFESLVEGLGEAQQEFACNLTGGDTVATPGPLTLTVTMLGEVEKGRMIRRSGAHAGDHIYVSGTIGDAALGLALRRLPSRADQWGLEQQHTSYLLDRYLRPRPRSGLAVVLREYASAGMDISDGLVGDLEKLCQSSNAGSHIEAARIPLSGAARKALNAEENLLSTILAGGDDYEILATVPGNQVKDFEAAAKDTGIPVTRIGRSLENGAKSGVYLADGIEITLKQAAFEHF